MALRNCPECGKEVSDKAYSCPNCGYPICDDDNDDHSKFKQLTEVCKCCGYQNQIGIDYCENCGMRITNYVRQEGNIDNSKKTLYGIPDSIFLRNPTEESFTPNFKGIYRYTVFGRKQEVYCPRCGSEDCSHYKESHVIPGKKTTRYSMNLNPFKPFTLVNKKEKVIREDRTVTDNKFVCNSCGKVFW